MITAYDYYTSGKPIRLLCIQICLLLIATLVSACGGSDNPPDATIVMQPRCGATALPSYVLLIDVYRQLELCEWRVYMSKDIKGPDIAHYNSRRSHYPPINAELTCWSFLSHHFHLHRMNLHGARSVLQHSIPTAHLWQKLSSLKNSPDPLLHLLYSMGR